MALEKGQIYNKKNTEELYLAIGTSRLLSFTDEGFKEKIVSYRQERLYEPFRDTSMRSLAKVWGTTIAEIEKVAVPYFRTVTPKSKFPSARTQDRAERKRRKEGLNRKPPCSDRFRGG